MIQGQLKKTEKDYRELLIDSSSSLKEFATDRRKYYKKYVKREKVEEEDSKAAIVGSLVDTLLFTPDEFDNRFYMSSIASIPTGLMLDFVEALYKHTMESTNTEGDISRDFKEIALDAYKDAKFKWSFETVLEKFVGKDPEIYYKEIREVRSKNLTIVSADDVTNAERIIEELKNNEFIGPLINLETNEKFNVINQLKVENFPIYEIPMKAMIDKVIVDHDQKLIKIYDLKCVWAVENFYEEYYLYRKSYIQAYVYKRAIEHLTRAEDSPWKGYTVDIPAFIVCDSINYYSPLIYQLTEEDMKDAVRGFKYKERNYPGVVEIVENLKWAKENNKWNISRKNYQRGGVVPIKQ